MMMRKLENKNKFLKVISLSIICFLVFFSMPFVHNNLASKIIQKGISGSNIKVQNLDVDFGIREIKISNIQANFGHTNIKIPNLNVSYSLKKLLLKRKTEFSITSNLIELNDSKVAFNVNVNGVFNSREGNTKFESESESLKIDKSIKGISSLKLSLDAEIDSKNINLSKINLKINDGVLKGSSEIKNGFFGVNSVAAQFALENIPIKLYKAFLSENSGLYQLSLIHISQGIVR